MTRLSLIVAGICLLSGCMGASAPEERTFYLLRARVGDGSTSIGTGAVVTMGNVRVAPYLNRAGIIVQLGEYRLREARFHLWAEPLDRGISYYLGERVTALLDRTEDEEALARKLSRYRIDVSVDEFHGTLEGEARLVARWALREGKARKDIQTQRFARTKSQQGAGYAGLVATQIALLDELAEVIASELKESR